MYKSNLSCLLLITLLLAPFSLFAQDVFSSAGTSTKSYKYIEGQYLFDSGLDDPYILSAYYSIADNIALRFSYSRLAVPNFVTQLTDTNGISRSFVVNGAVQTIWAGAVYHKPFSLPDGDSALSSILNGTDWIAGADIGSEKTSANVVSTGQKFSESETVQRLFLGLRKALGPKLEAQAGVNYEIDGSSSSASLDVVAVYRIGGFLDAAVGVIDVGDRDQVGAGLRYTW